MKFSILLSSLLLLPVFVMAGGDTGFVPLVGIPGIQGGDFNQYVNALYGLAISIAALIAVVKIVLAGAKYMMDDIVTHKSEAKEDIKNALIGLLIIIGAWIILNTINSNLTNLSINADPVPFDNSIPPFINRVDSLVERAQELNSVVKYAYCKDFWDQSDCIEACRTTYRGEMSYDGPNSCAYIEAIANECDPNLSADCCITIKGGDWNNSDKICSRLEVVALQRELECYSENKTWDAEKKLCTTVRCPNNGSICTVNGSYKQDFADENCPPEATSCRTIPSVVYCQGLIEGNLSGCQNQCLEVRNGVAFNEDTWDCVFINGERPVTNTLNIDLNITYTQKQNEDEIAGDYPVRQIEIISNTSVNGLVKVRYKDTGKEVDMACDYIVPNPCVNN